MRADLEFFEQSILLKILDGRINGVTWIYPYFQSFIISWCRPASSFLNDLTINPGYWRRSERLAVALLCRWFGCRVRIEFLPFWLLLLILQWKWSLFILIDGICMLACVFAFFFSMGRYSIRQKSGPLLHSNSKLWKMTTILQGTAF